MLDLFDSIGNVLDFINSGKHYSLSGHWIYLLGKAFPGFLRFAKYVDSFSELIHGYFFSLSSSVKFDEVKSEYLI